MFMTSICLVLHESSTSNLKGELSPLTGTGDAGLSVVDLVAPL